MDNIILDVKKFGISYYNYPVQITDGSGNYEKEDILNLAKSCNVVVIMYDYQNMSSFHKIKTEILPTLKLLEKDIYSIIIVGNKVDILDPNSHKYIIEQDKNEVEKQQEDMVTTLKFFDISSKNYYNINPLLHEILESLVYPSNLFYSSISEEGGFNEKFIKALHRVYRIIDKERRGVISKADFMKIHEEIFKLKLENDHFQALTDLIKTANPENQMILQQTDDLTLEGFISLNTLSVQINECQIPWTILRKFGYTDELLLDSIYYNSKHIEKSDTSTNEYLIELSDYSTKLLISLFNQFAVTQGDPLNNKNAHTNIFACNPNNFLTEKEWNQIFFPYSGKLNNDFYFDRMFCTWKNKIEAKIFIEDWLLLWNSHTRTNSEETFKVFLYLGFDVDYSIFVKKIKRKEINLFNPLEQKTVYVNFVTDKQEDLNNFMKQFLNFYAITLGNGKREIILRKDNYCFIISHLLINELEISFMSSDPLKKFDLIIISSDIAMSKEFSKFFPSMLPFMIYYKKGDPLGDNKLSDCGINAENINEDVICNKILQFTQHPLNFIKEVERSEIIRNRRRKLYIGFGIAFAGIAGGLIYIFGFKKYNLFKTFSKFK